MMQGFLLLVFLFLASPAFGAIAFDAAGGGGSSSDVWTFAHTATGTTTDGLLLVGCGIITGGGTDVQSMTANGDAMTQVPSGNVHASVMRQTMWYRKLPDVGTYNIQVTLNNPVESACVSITLTGVDQVTTFGTAVTGTNTGVPSVTVTTAAGELVVDTVSCNSATLDAAGANQTQRGSDQGAGGNVRTGMSTQAGADGGVMSWSTCGAVQWNQVAVPVKEAVAAATRRAITPLFY